MTDKDLKRFWAKVLKTDSCWIWTASLSWNGYGRFGLKGKTVRAHRVSYEISNDKIPLGYEPDHLCKTPYCVNPDHLEIVTKQENNRRSSSPSALNARKTQCNKGHQFTESNTYKIKSGGRGCKQCRRENVIKFRSKSKSEGRSNEE